MMHIFQPSMTKNLLAASAIGIAGLAFIQPAMAQSRLNTTTMPVTTLWLQEPGEIAEARDLLNEGKAEAAIKIMEVFLARPHLPGPHRYASLNALCIAYAMNGDMDVALEKCDKAIELMPRNWQAINSRATVKYFAGNYAAALEDYRHALALSPKSEVVLHNIALAEGQISNS